MSEESENDIGGLAPATRGIIVAAFVASIGSGSLAVVGTQDRYTAAEAGKDFELVAVEITHLNRDVARNEATIKAIDDNHPPKELTDRVERLQQEVAEIKLIMARNGSK